MPFKKQILINGVTPAITCEMFASPPFNQKEIPSYRLHCTECKNFFMCFEEDNFKDDGKDITSFCDTCKKDISEPEPMEVEEFIGHGSAAKVFEMCANYEKDARGQTPVYIEPDDPKCKKKQKT